MNPLCKAFFVRALTEDGQDNMDLIVYAPDAHGALHLWKDHYTGWDYPARVTLYELPQTYPNQPVALPWKHMQRHQLPTDLEIVP